MRPIRRPKKRAEVTSKRYERLLWATRKKVSKYTGKKIDEWKKVLELAMQRRTINWTQVDPVLRSTEEVVKWFAEYYNPILLKFIRSVKRTDHPNPKDLAELIVQYNRSVENTKAMRHLIASVRERRARETN